MNATIHHTNEVITGKTLKDIRRQMCAMLRGDIRGLTATVDNGAEIHVELYEGRDYIRTADGKIIK